MFISKKRRYSVYIIIVLVILSYSLFNLTIYFKRPYQFYKLIIDYYVEKKNYQIALINSQDLLALPKIEKPHLTAANIKDVSAAFVADPFLLKDSDVFYLFFEIYNLKTSKGEIGVALSQDGRQWRYLSVVLSEPFHLSYPQVFKYNNDYYMIPESCQANGIRLYKAIKFPYQWQYVKTLIEGKYVDASFYYYDSKYWLFATDTSLGNNNNLVIFYADDLLGPWQSHALNPIIDKNPHHARCAGRIIKYHNKIIRFAQDDFPEYGKQIYAFEVATLSPDSYKEVMLGKKPILGPGPQSWNKGGMHHIDALQLPDNTWLIAVDGWGKKVRLTTNWIFSLLTFWPLLNN